MSKRPPSKRVATVAEAKFETDEEMPEMHLTVTPAENAVAAMSTKERILNEILAIDVSTPGGAALMSEQLLNYASAMKKEDRHDVYLMGLVIEKVKEQELWRKHPNTEFESEHAYWQAAGWELAEIDAIYKPFQVLVPAFQTLGMDAAQTFEALPAKARSVVARKVKSLTREADRTTGDKGKLGMKDVLQSVPKMVTDVMSLSNGDIRRYDAELNGKRTKEPLHIQLRLVPGPHGSLIVELSGRWTYDDISGLADNTLFPAYSLDGETVTAQQIREEMDRRMQHPAPVIVDTSEPEEAPEQNDDMYELAGLNIKMGDA